MVGFADFVNINFKVVPVQVSYTDLLYKFMKGVPPAYEYVKTKQGHTALTLDFLKFNAMPGELEINDYDLSVSFPDHLPAKVCEDVYQTLQFWKPIGTSLLTNRSDLFVKLKEASGILDELSAKKFKLQKKLAKVERKIEDLIKEVEV